MSCSAEQIAEKRRIAIERLNARKNSNKNAVSTPAAANPAQSGGPSKGATLTANSFYGQNNERTATSNPAHQRMLRDQRNTFSPYSRPTKKDTPTKVAPIFARTVTCACSLVSEERFIAETNGYSEPLIEIFKRIPSKSYEPNTKKWTFELTDYSLLQTRVATLHPNVILSPIPSFVMREFSSGPKPKPGHVFLNAIDTTLVDSLLDFQKDGVSFAIDKGGRVLIADEMGLGKTYQAIAVADFYQHDWPLLICTTATTRDSWAAKLRQLLPSIPAHRIVVLNSGQDNIGDCRVLISSYSLMERCCDKLLEHRFETLIFDESHTLKNFKAKCTIVAIALSKKAKRIILLSGTPALSRPVELFTQLQMLDQRFCSFKEYSTRYCAGKQSNFGWDASGQSNLTELNLLLSRKFMIRRTKDEVMSELTEKSRETVILDPSYLWTNEEIGSDMDCYASDYSQSKGRQREDILIKYYSMTAQAKAPAVCAYLKEVLKEGKKFIIFAHHFIMLDAIEKCLSKRKVDFIRIDGSTRSDLRTPLVDKFQTNASCRAAVLSLKACNAGITLTAAQLVLFAELDWNPATLAQAESRAHRIGQMDNVTVRYLLAKKTADDIIWAMLQRKQTTLTKVGLCNEDFSEASHVEAPSDAGSIRPYLDKSLSPAAKSFGPIDQFVLRSKTSPAGACSTKEGFQRPDGTNVSSFLAHDDDDDELAGLEL
ncbi:SWI/SNF-related matrix-associated actin-dependent regulator of chromatin subfamily A-like protein 1 [Anopheles bellator]|uniref:SWI/SNF-related matrix-associated actin-dependent regulator of chromatin subfamily A-like protein 1 n=1 Tax=Anopheles bellator TaxID=139047 RepID=UPI002647648D|nr:SWI/SNF-related matrix-associated actin-dependent regulator of chromatin subfamily A-like protein 1 [Anopheles bellator]